MASLPVPGATFAATIDYARSPMVGARRTGEHAAMPLLRAAAVYFLCAFGAGFVLGALRVTLLVPRLGARTAELLELPVMVAIVVVVARWRVRRTPAWSPARQLAVGWLAWILLLLAEFALAALLSGRSPREVLAAHDPVAAVAYYMATGVFALAPWAVARRRTRRAVRAKLAS